MPGGMSVESGSTYVLALLTLIFSAFDSLGKLPSGMEYLDRLWLGDYDTCRNITLPSWDFRMF